MRKSLDLLMVRPHRRCIVAYMFKKGISILLWLRLFCQIKLENTINTDLSQENTFGGGSDQTSPQNYRLSYCLIFHLLFVSHQRAEWVMDRWLKSGRCSKQGANLHHSEDTKSLNFLKNKELTCLKDELLQFSSFWSFFVGFPPGIRLTALKKRNERDSAQCSAPMLFLLRGLFFMCHLTWQ